MPPCLESLRSLATAALHQYGFQGTTIGGLVNRQGQRLLIFDMDGTRQVARQRTLVDDPAYLVPRRQMQRRIQY
jgi:hypothetical protein